MEPIEHIAIPITAKKPEEKVEAVKPVEKPTKEVKSEPVKKEEITEQPEPFRRPYQNGLTWQWSEDLTKEPLFRTICNLLGEYAFDVVQESPRQAEIIKQIGKMVIEKRGANEDEIAKELAHLRRYIPYRQDNIKNLMGIYELLKIDQAKHFRGGEK